MSHEVVELDAVKHPATFGWNILAVLDEVTAELRARPVEVLADHERQLRERAVLEGEDVSVFGRNHVPPAVPSPT